MARVRCWCFTIFNYDTQAIKDTIGDMTDKIKYCVFQEELCPKTQKRHLQGYIVFENSTRLNAIKKLFNDKTMHLECARGTPQENREYCTKDDTRLEGTEPIEYGNINLCGSGARTDLDEVRERILYKGATKDDIQDDFPFVFGRYPKFVDYAIERSLRPKVKIREPPTVVYISGPTKVGKTKMAIEMTKDVNVYNITDNEKGWFDGYMGEKTVIIDEFEGKLPRNILLTLTDRYPITKRYEIKGGFTWCDPDVIIFTSNYEIDDLTWDQTTKNAFKRRITKFIKLKKEYKDN